jgi:hypothetical protein
MQRTIWPRLPACPSPSRLEANLMLAFMLATLLSQAAALALLFAQGGQP